MLPLALLALLSHASAAEVIFTPDAPSPSLPACLRSAYHGEFGGRHVYLPSAECAQDFNSGSIAAVDSDDAIVWVTRAGLEGDDSALIGDLFAPPSSGADGAQAVMQAPSPLSLLHADEESFFLSIPRTDLPRLDSLLPRHLSSVVLGGPVPLDGRWEVPKSAARHLAKLIENLTFRAEVDDLLDELSADTVAKHVRYLTGEAKDSSIRSRHAMHPDARIAALYIREQMTKAGFECSAFPVLPETGWSPSVICALDGQESTDQVVVSAHYDSRGSFGSVYAPGANDDASGTAHLLTLGEVIGKHKLKFEKTLVLAFWSGEEQGLLGSHSAAEYLAKQNATVTINVQADMLGYHVPGEPPQLALPEKIHTPEASYLVSNVSALYAPTLVVGRTGACCTDHQSFLTYGFPATALFERNGPIADPMYHNSGDVSDRIGYDFEQIKTIARVTLATALEAAGAKLGKGKK